YIRPRVAPPPVIEDHLDPRGSIEGTITSRTGEPLAQVRVCANAVSPRVLAVEPLPRCTQTDARGRYTIAALLAGAYRMLATAPAYEPGGRDLTVMSNERRRLDMTAHLTIPAAWPQPGHGQPTDPRTP
ncbi:MAG: carboxypeptidase regulatory-like domain-containing protein, partial [Deltaproteobacteria bacterium]|nr:carboxypeptidase regulatory-like domain-containing protein [Deltaproteobacteria bacterium]